MTLEEIEKAIAAKGKEMRNAQNLYYRTPQNNAFKVDYLQKSKAVEQEFDKLLRAHNAEQERLVKEKVEPKLFT